MILTVIFVVLMMFWVFAGIAGWDRTNNYALAGTLIPWLCVAILGWMLFSGAPPPARL